MLHSVIGSSREGGYCRDDAKLTLYQRNPNVLRTEQHPVDYILPAGPNFETRPDGRANEETLLLDQRLRPVRRRPSPVS